MLPELPDFERINAAESWKDAAIDCSDKDNTIR